MEDLFLLLFLFSSAALVIGLIKPSLFARLRSNLATRKRIALIFGGGSITLFVLFGITSSPIEQKQLEALVQQNQEITSISNCSPSVREVPPQSGTPSRFADRKHFEEIHCGDAKITEFKLSRQLTNITVFKDEEVQVICSFEAGPNECDTRYSWYDPNNVLIIFSRPPQSGSIVKITGVEALPSEMQKPQPPTLSKIIFDIPNLITRTYPQLKATLGNPTREVLPAPLLEMDGWAEWDKEGFILSINYNRFGVLVNDGTLACALSLLPKRGYLSEEQLRVAGNLPKGDPSFITEMPFTGLISTFSIRPAYDSKSQLYAIDVCL